MIPVSAPTSEFSPKAMTVATLVVATREVKGVHPDERRTTSHGTSVSPRQANSGWGLEALKRHGSARQRVT